MPDALIKEILPQGDFYLQEERRLFYVGMTRAKEELYFTSAEDYGGSRLRRLSQFVLEAQGKEAPAKPKVKTSALEAIERFKPRKASLPAAPAPIPEDRLVNLSYYQIDDYLTCPLKYKYVNILRVPIMEHHTVIYGRAMHEAVSRYFQHKMSGEKMDLATLLNVFEQSFDPQGFLDEKHQKERFRVGCDALVRFFKDEEGRNAELLSIEQEFSFVMENIKIAGRFDRVDKRDGRVVIMDFKTSEIKAQKDADKRVKESKQLLLYSLAWQYIKGELPQQIALYFLESGIIGVTEVKEKALDQIKEDIRTVACGIRRQDYRATPTYMACNYCACNQICPSAVLK